MIGYIVGQGLKRYWKKALGGVVVATLLLPLPAFAGGFLGNWTIAEKQTGTAPYAFASAELYVNGGTLTIDLGSHKQAGSSSVIASNFYYVDYPSQIFAITDGVAATQMNSDLKFDVIFYPITPGNPLYFTPPVNNYAGNFPQPLLYNNTSATYLPGGLYWVVVKIKSTNFNRFSRTRDISPFSFTFTGI